MAAWIALAAMCGAWVGGWLAYIWAKGQQAQQPVLEPWTGPPHDPVLSPEFMEKILTRLLDASIPPAREAELIAASGVGAPHDPGELDDSEWVGAMDWTDPFIAPERPIVARLAPGERISQGAEDSEIIERWRQQGATAFDEMDATTGAAWVAPIDLGDGQGPIE